jgi:HAD superfamily hydrolase (TIGR01549 family)
VSLRAIEAVLFDFHGTLVHGGGFSFDVAMGTLLGSLSDSGLVVDEDGFRSVYRREVRRYFELHANQGREQHNTVWVARALTELGHACGPDDEPVRRAVDAYFDRFSRELTSYPGAADLLRGLHGRYRLGLLSNFTDPRPVHEVLAREGFAPYLDAVVISADLGRRKPIPAVFRRALEELGARAETTLFVGDDPADDIAGARAVGMRTAWVRPGADAPLLRWMNDDEPGEAEGADLTLERVTDLLDLLPT